MFYMPVSVRQCTLARSLKFEKNKKWDSGSEGGRKWRSDFGFVWSRVVLTGVPPARPSPAPGSRKDPNLPPELLSGRVAIGGRLAY